MVRRRASAAACATDSVGYCSKLPICSLRRTGFPQLRAHATDGATNTMIRENRDTAPPGALLRSRRCAYGCRSFRPCDVLFRSLYFLAANWMAESGIGIAFGAYFVNLASMPHKHGS